MIVLCYWNIRGYMTLTLTIVLVNQICKETSWASFLLLPCGGKPSLSHIYSAKMKLLEDNILRPALWGGFSSLFIPWEHEAEEKLWATDFVYIMLWMFSHVIVADQRLEAGLPSSHSESCSGPGDECLSSMSHAAALPPVLSPVYVQCPIQDLCFNHLCGVSAHTQAS